MLIRADARAVPLVDGSVHCVVTSPPYWGLRDYGTPGQLGLESSPDAYVASLVTVFREVWRVLRNDGTCWVNLGDSYNADGRKGRAYMGTGKNKGYSAWVNKTGFGTKHKDLVGIPWRVAFALQADGWYLRADIIWSKPNPMPESVTDRPTKAHEYLFLLAKSARYYYDAAAIAEPASDAMYTQVAQGYDGQGRKAYDAAGVQNPSVVKARIIGNVRKRADRFGGNKHSTATTKHSDGSVYTGRVTRNKRSVWTISTMPYPDAHFATFPEALVEPCILAGCPLGGLVLDPFIGSGTVGAVAERLGRHWVGVDVTYQQLAKARTVQRGLQFAEAQ
jgi:DNA modification methylase